PAHGRRRPREEAGDRVRPGPPPLALTQDHVLGLELPRGGHLPELGGGVGPELLLVPGEVPVRPARGRDGYRPPALRASHRGPRPPRRDGQDGTAGTPDPAPGGRLGQILSLLRLPDGAAE